MIQLPDNYWAFIPGPSAIHDPPESSVDLQEVAEAFLGYPGFSLLHDADPSWWQWRAGWERGRSFLVVEMTLFETTPIAWGGSGVSGYCALEELLALWHALREQFSAMWLHNSQCEIHTPESFHAVDDRQSGLIERRRLQTTAAYRLTPTSSRWFSRSFGSSYTR